MVLEKNTRRWIALALASIAFFWLALQTVPVRAELRHQRGTDRDALVEMLENADVMNVRQFWQWRDQTNGFFTFDPTTTHAGMTRRIDEPTQDEWLLHTFTSKTILSSTDELYRDEGTMEAVLEAKARSYPESEFVVRTKGKDFMLFRAKNSDQLLLLFVKDASALIDVDGLFDFIELERSYLENRYWVNTTVLQ